MPPDIGIGAAELVRCRLCTIAARQGHAIHALTCIACLVYQTSLVALALAAAVAAAAASPFGEPRFPPLPPSHLVDVQAPLPALVGDQERHALARGLVGHADAAAAEGLRVGSGGGSRRSVQSSPYILAPVQLAAQHSNVVASSVCWWRASSMLELGVRAAGAVRQQAGSSSPRPTAGVPRRGCDIAPAPGRQRPQPAPHTRRLRTNLGHCAQNVGAVGCRQG